VRGPAEPFHGLWDPLRAGRTLAGLDSLGAINVPPMKPRTRHLAAFVAAATAPVRPLMTARSLVSALACSVTLSVASAQVGTNYCTPAPNSTGAMATISDSGSAAVTLNNLTLASSDLPQNAAAYFLCSRTQGFGQNPGGSAGNICPGAPIGRVVGGVITNSGTTGTVSVLADLAAMPQPSGAVVVQAGETWNFQCWYRDAVTGGGSTSNSSDGLTVTFDVGSGDVLFGPVVNPANGHLYVLLGPSPWVDAQADARTLGGDLVTIDDAAEATWVANFIQAGGNLGQTWIGLFRTPTTSWGWVSGVPTNFTNWAPGEPNNVLDNELCTAMYPVAHPWGGATEWIDAPSSWSLPSVVEIP